MRIKNSTTIVIPPSYVKPQGQLAIEENGIFDVKTYETVNVQIQGGTPGSGGTGDVTASTNFGALVDRSITTLSGEDLEGVTTIGKYSFYGCTNLTDIAIAEGVEKIDTYAFYGCKNLKTVTLPSTLTTIGTYAFANCSALNEINMGGTSYISSYAFTNCTGLSVIDLSDVGYVESNAFSGWTSAQTIKVLSIDRARSWGSNSDLTTWAANANVQAGEQEVVKDDTYYYYTAIGSGDNKVAVITGRKEGMLNIPENSDTLTVDYVDRGYPIVRLEGNIFRDIDEENFKKIIGRNVTSISGNAFTRCTNLQEIIFPNVLDISNTTEPIWGNINYADRTQDENNQVTRIIMPKLSSVSGSLF